MSLTTEEAKYFELLQKQAESAELQKLQLQNDLGKLSSFTPNKEQNLVEYQLDIKEELDRLHHLLSGHTLGLQNGNEVWLEPDDDRLKIFSDYGVKEIMKIVSLYVNRNTLLSNYDEETIKWKVKDFALELTDLIFSRYEVFFHYPTPEELFDECLPLIKEKKSKISEDELYMKCVQWSKEELQSKYKHFSMIIVALTDTVHSTYLRALKGEERETLRKFIHVSQNTSPMTPAQSQAQGFNLFKPNTWK